MPTEIDDEFKYGEALIQSTLKKKPAQSVEGAGEYTKSTSPEG